MRINLIETEIHDALIQYITNQGIDISGKDVTVSLTAGRGPSGHKAAVDILNAGSTKVSSEEAAPDNVAQVTEPAEEQQAIPFD